VKIRPHVPKTTPKSISRFKNVESPLGPSPPAEPSPTPVKRKRDFELLTPSDSHPAKKAKADNPVKEEEASTTVKEELISIEESTSFNEEARLSPSPPSSSAQSRPISSRSSPSEGTTSTDATSVDEETIVVEPKRTATIMADLKSGQGGKLTRSPGQAKASRPVLFNNSNITNSHTLSIQNDKALLLELDSSIELDESSMTTTPKKGTKRKRKLPRPTTDLDHAPAVRVHGDYVLTPALLGEPASAWINCKICEEPFVQKDAYCTRSSCPRCERHSKLYGYMWPKTDKEGRNDTEERVLDHRTVHRFIRPSEERTVRKRGKSSTRSPVVSRDVSAVVSEKSEAPRRRGRRKA
jgi:histone-lysine N-methyltransferase SUV420H